MTIPWSVMEFAQMVHSPASRHKALAMLVARFDESGVHDAAEITCIAGVIGRALEWTRIERPWQEHLRLAGVSCFHATECAVPKKRKGEYYPLPEPIRTTLFNNCAQAIADRDLRLIVGAVVKKDWELPEFQKLRDRFQTPYHFCFESVLQYTEHWSRTFADGEPVALEFAEHEEYSSRAGELYELYRASPAYRCIGHFGWGKPKCLIPLQAADLVCYESWQHMWGYDRPGYKPREPLQKILPQYVEMSGFYDAEHLRNLQGLMDEKAKSA